MPDQSYQPKSIESKWQQYWDLYQTFAVTDKERGERSYVLDMFPYPSAQGLHVGHPLSYVATDIYSRYLRMKGVNVLHPMGWDAFGLPAENFAIKSGVHPRATIWQSIDNFRRQFKMLGLSYDWAREINTADPSYCRWTQWLFLKLYERGLAYRQEAPVNWCPSCQTVLANEQVINDECERCGSPVEQRQMKQWFFKITAYTEQLLQGFKGLDWPQSIIDMQRNWIGKSEGAEVEFKIKNQKSKIKIFTTRLDTIFGATYLVLAPEHPLAQQLAGKITNWDEVQTYIEQTKKKTELERKVEGKQRTGVRLEGVEAVNPASNECVPVFMADYVLVSYGTGAIMAVPAHDQRDWEFAQHYKLPVKTVVAVDGSAGDHPGVYTAEGVLINSGKFTHQASVVARQAIIAWLATKKLAKPATRYRLRDWLISRQRYWGAPIPIIYCASCGELPVPEQDLPVKLPDDVDFRPTGESPLARSQSFHQVNCPTCGKPAKRESDTMDTFVDSSWYWLRYCDPHNDTVAFDHKKVKRWCPVNLYMGGAEHAVLHLLYARFITKVLYHSGQINFTEPFLKLKNQGLILGEDGQKMSKSRGNVINPDDIVNQYGADSLRLYEMFMGPLEDSKPWSSSSIVGVRRFLERVWRQVTEADIKLVDATKALNQALDRATKKVTDDIKSFHFNTAISSLMELSNWLSDHSPLGRQAVERLLLLLYPFAPHIVCELWQQCGFPKNIWENSWPKWQEKNLREESVNIVVQINGRRRAVVSCSPELSEAEVGALAIQDKNVSKHLTNQTIKQTFYRPGRLINFVTGD